MLVSDYNYDLPEERIAKFPPKERGTTRLLVLDKKTGKTTDSHYADLDEFLNPGDLLILNDTRVMQSRLFCTLPDGRKRELVVLEKHGNEPQRVMYRGKLHEGDQLMPIHSIQNGSLRTRSRARPSLRGARSFCLDQRSSAGRRLDTESKLSVCSAPTAVGRNLRQIPQQTISGCSIIVKHLDGNGIAEVESSTPLAELAEKYGTVPLPPYLHRDATENDKKRYQTVWAKNMGSAAAPTASLNMTEELLDKLRKKGVIIKYLTLHVGLGTFLPIRTDNIEEHKMHSEWFHIPEETIEAIREVIAKTKPFVASSLAPVVTGLASSFAPVVANAPHDSVLANMATVHPRIVALGTTVARTLEYYAKTGKTSGEDDIFIYPGFEFKLVDALITNFHAPKSTVLMLAAAFAGWENLHNAYNHAVEEKYNFLSYGDSMLIC